MMATVHVTPGYSARGSLRRAVEDAGLTDEVVGFPDDLSGGPINPGDPASRAAWWGSFYEDYELQEIQVREFWDRVSDPDARLVLWFGRHYASEFAFSLFWADMLGERPYEIIDVTGLRLPSAREGGSYTSRGVSIMPPDRLRALLGTERTGTDQERLDARRSWQQLKKENAPFRIVTETGLVSARADHFDPLILEQATTEWQKVSRVIGFTMGRNDEPYIQVGDLMLLQRLVALVEAGKLVAEGDPWDMSGGRVRLPE